jgi:hypothetical protein
MSSQRAFIPGGKNNFKRIVNYTALYNQLNSNSLNENNTITQCTCYPIVYNKNIPGADSPSTRVSYNTRISQIINFYKGGKTQYGNFYLGQPLQLNYLGRAEGMPGGSGMPPKNRFN